MSGSSDVLKLLARYRPARLDPPPDRLTDSRTAIADLAARAATSEGQAMQTQIPRPRRTRLAVFGAVGAAAVAAVAVVAVVSSGSGAVPHGITSGPGASVAGNQAAGNPADASGVLLTAAESTEKAAPASGRYLTIQTESGFAMPIDAASGPYVMFGKTNSQYWLAQDKSQKSWVTSQWVGATPVSADDDAAWRRAGSPATVKSTKPKPSSYSVGPGQRMGNSVDAAHLFGFGDKNASQAQLDALPTDPAALKAALLATFTGGGGDMPTDRDQWLLGAAASVVTDLPVSNAVRSAAYRMIATLPGVRGLGEVRDAHGRPGQAIAFTQDSPVIGRFEVRLIIDPATGQTLSREMRAVAPQGTWSWLKPGAIATYQVTLVWQKTNDNPPKFDVVK